MGRCVDRDDVGGMFVFVAITGWSCSLQYAFQPHLSTLHAIVAQFDFIVSNLSHNRDDEDIAQMSSSSWLWLSGNTLMWFVASQIFLWRFEWRVERRWPICNTVSIWIYPSCTYYRTLCDDLSLAVGCWYLYDYLFILPDVKVRRHLMLNRFPKIMFECKAIIKNEWK